MIKSLFSITNLTYAMLALSLFLSVVNIVSIIKCEKKSEELDEQLEEVKIKSLNFDYNFKNYR